ncbi:dnaJ homolog subfamily C member 2-like [Trifolium pratense]|uniref:dnaJ homolog subfamily C member 2-like n=1 Tax=Trifolium pratense TaxID=57577 RepID=UPI001E691225|nr:dnaJ homolog subfamily C member 2-like [Trifolium pratense]
MAVHTKYRLITYSPEIVDGKPIFVSSNCLPAKALKYEPAGHSFHSAALKLMGVNEEKDNKDDNKKVVGDKEQAYLPTDSYSSKSKKKSGDKDKQQQDHYALLGLSHLRYLATEDQIRKSYRDAALRFHPDKQAALLLAEETEAAKEAKKVEIETHFLAIQEAYEVLVDPTKRRIYDSTDEFDDEIPTDCAPQDFFKVFGPAFMRNGRWSVTQPIPSLGDDKTSIKEVDSFYDFWYSFKSWREFPQEDECDLDQAENREHKRWMERQNAKLSEKARKEEYVRIRTLVENAYKRDPRILRRKEEIKAEKKRKKESKFMAKKLEEEEAARIAEEEKKRKAEEDKKAAEAALQQKKVREKEKKLLRKERTRLRTLSGPISSQHIFDISEDNVEELCMSFDIDQLRGLCEKMEGKELLEQAEALRDAVSGKKHVVDEKSNQQNGTVKANGSSSSLAGYAEKKEKPWTKEEIELLRKGVQKFPKGTSRRWEVVSEYIGTGRSVEEILKATKTVLLQKPDTAKAFDTFLEKRKPAAQSIESPLSTREELERVSIPATTPENSAAFSTTTTTPPTPTPVATTKTTPTAPTMTTTTATKNIINSEESQGVSEQEVWSAVQERALVQALKTFPKEANQRWERVAAAVPGKTVNQCKKKFAMMKENFRNKKTAV